MEPESLVAEKGGASEQQDVAWVERAPMELVAVLGRCGGQS